jgi:dinuclear metal center YbgI/SA1388 family protein
MTILRKDLVHHLNELLSVQKTKDYCPNGLQVEGRSEINRIVTGVTASEALIDEAISRQADAVLVHHGYFWKGEDECVVGIKKKRLQKLLANDINVLAYHLPLDNHVKYGNNVQLAKLLDIEMTGRLVAHNHDVPGYIGVLQTPMSAKAFCAKLDRLLNRLPIHIGNDEAVIKNIAWCTGGAQGYFQYAIDAGVDAYITGEISEPSAHLANETGTHFISAGHHATERYGVKALGEYIAENFKVEVDFVDIDNPA